TIDRLPSQGARSRAMASGGTGAQAVGSATPTSGTGSSKGHAAAETAVGTVLKSADGLTGTCGAGAATAGECAPSVGKLPGSAPDRPGARPTVTPGSLRGTLGVPGPLTTTGSSRTGKIGGSHSSWPWTPSLAEKNKSPSATPRFRGSDEAPPGLMFATR